MSSPRFPYLYQAVRAGIQIMPEAAPPGRYFGVSATTGQLGCDALAVAWLAQFYDQERSENEAQMFGLFSGEALADAFPVLRQDMGPGCPAGPTGSCAHPPVNRMLYLKIIHLEDRHGFSREQVADWLKAHGL